jgi:hypothetical protein
MLFAGWRPQKVSHISAHHRISQRSLFTLRMPNTFRPVDPADRTKRSAAFKAEMDNLFYLTAKTGADIAGRCSSNHPGFVRLHPYL